MPAKKRKTKTLRRPVQRAATKQKRLEQMLDELERGGVYMNMKWRPRLPE